MEVKGGMVGEVGEIIVEERVGKVKGSNRREDKGSKG